MNETDALDLMRDAIKTVIIVSTPAVAVAMIVGLVVALIQALTQVQEMTLTFVPKIVAVFLACLLSAHFMGAKIFGFAELAFSRIETGF